jgi:hypothetical protein
MVHVTWRVSCKGRQSNEACLEAEIVNGVQIIIARLRMVKRLLYAARLEEDNNSGETFTPLLLGFKPTLGSGLKGRVGAGRLKFQCNEQHVSMVVLLPSTSCKAAAETHIWAAPTLTSDGRGIDANLHSSFHQPHQSTHGPL